MIRPIYPDMPNAPRGLMYAILISLFLYGMVGLSLVMATSVYPSNPHREAHLIIEYDFARGK